MPRRLTTRPERRPPTFDLARDACEAHFRETGMTPTTEIIVERIGVQNRPLIRRAIEDWLLDLPARLYRREELPGVPQPVAEQFRQLWESAVRTAGEKFAAERVEWQNRLAEEQTKLAETEAQRAALTEDLERLASERAELSASKDALRAELAKEGRLRETAESVLSRTGTELERLKADLETERRQAAERAAFLEARLEKEHAWAMQRIAEERATAEKAAQREIDRRDRDITDLRLALSRAEAAAQGLREDYAGLKVRAEQLDQTRLAAEAARDEKIEALALAQEAMAELRVADRLQRAELEALRAQLAAQSASKASESKSLKRTGR